MARYCPSCGASNPDSANFCSDCSARLLGTVRGVKIEVDEKQEASALHLQDRRPPSLPKGKLNLGVISIILGAIGLGPFAVAAAGYALHKRLPGRRYAIAGLALGSFATLVLIVLLFSLAGRGDPLRRWDITPENVTAFIAAAETRIGRIQTDADELRSRLGPGGGVEVSAVYAQINAGRRLLSEMELCEDLDELVAMRDGFMDRLDIAQKLLKGW